MPLKKIFLSNYRSRFSQDDINCLLSEMSSGQLTENDVTRTSSNEPDWDIFELNSNCDGIDGGGGGGIPGRDSDSK